MKFHHVIFVVGKPSKWHGPKSISGFNNLTIETLNSTALWIIDRKSDCRSQSWTETKRFRQITAIFRLIANICPQQLCPAAQLGAINVWLCLCQWKSFKKTSQLTSSFDWCGIKCNNYVLCGPLCDILDVFSFSEMAFFSRLCFECQHK